MYKRELNCIGTAIYFRAIIYLRFWDEIKMKFIVTYNSFVSNTVFVALTKPQNSVHETRISFQVIFTIIYIATLWVFMAFNRRWFLKNRRPCCSSVDIQKMIQITTRLTVSFRVCTFKPQNSVWTVEETHSVVQSTFSWRARSSPTVGCTRGTEYTVFEPLARNRRTR